MEKTDFLSLRRNLLKASARKVSLLGLKEKPVVFLKVSKQTFTEVLFNVLLDSKLEIKEQSVVLTTSPVFGNTLVVFVIDDAVEGIYEVDYEDSNLNF